MTQSEHIITTADVKLDGASLTPAVADLLVEVIVDDHRWLPDSVELRFRDNGLTVVDSGGFEVGKKLKVGARQGDRVAELAEVEVTAVELVYDPEGTWTIVRGLDAAHRLQRGRRIQSFVQQAVPDIFRKVVSASGAPLGTVASGPTLEEVIQPNISDWEFLRRLAGDYGLEVTVDRGKVGLSQPVKASRSADLTLRLGEHIMALRVAVSAVEAISKVEVRAWDPKQKKAVVGSAQSATDVAAIGQTSDPAKLAGTFGSRTLTVTDVPLSVKSNDLTTMARGFADQVGAASVDLEVTTMGNPGGKSGAVVQLEGVGTRFSGKYVVTAARHTLGPDGYQTTLSVSGRRDASLHGLTSAGAAQTGLVPGLVPGIVSNINDPDKKGRVKVTLPWLGDQLETDWARTVQMGGAKGGGIVIPEVDDEVLVGFEQGRLEYPYVIGGLYNGKDGPGKGAVDDVSSGAVSRRSFADRKGNRIELVDASNGETGVLVTTGDGEFSMYFDGKAQTIKIESSGKVEISSQSDLSLSTDGNLTLKAKGNISAEATGNFKAKATGNFEAEGMSATLKGQTAVSVQGVAAELKGSGSTTITGAIVKIN
jgi:phage protein D